MHSACGSGFLASAARGAFVPGYGRGFLVDASLLRNARACPSGLRRASRADLLLVGFFRFVLNEDARALGRRRRVSWRLEDIFKVFLRNHEATNLVQHRRLIYICQAGQKLVSARPGSDPRFSLLQALAGRSKRGGEA